MTPRRQRMLAVGLVIAGVALAAAFALRALQENLRYFYSPMQIAAGEAPEGRVFRVGGLVEHGSLAREPGSLELQFSITDHASSLPVLYSGVLPDLFREGQGVVVIGRLAEGGAFRADEVLAKHDENYMPPEVHDALKAGELARTLQE